MDVLDRIENLRNERGWSEYQLSIQSGLTQSTISTWYRKRAVPSVASIEKICNAFGITLSQFFATESDHIYSLTEDQALLIEVSLKLDHEQRIRLANFLKSL